ncbi:hypothetical protein [Coxiella burnetii]|uniref:hypothetical protein n=1 Tax=Coxiella burnetii TaxID=777 RepID=UPI0000DADD76
MNKSTAIEAGGFFLSGPQAAGTTTSESSGTNARRVRLKESTHFDGRTIIK